MPRPARAELPRLLGLPERARALTRDVERRLGGVTARLARVPPARRPRVYYARGPRGLETAAPGAINVEAIERLGAVNVVGTSLVAGTLGTVSLEQVLAWDPQVIIALDPRFPAVARSDPAWRGVRAVRGGRMHLVPLLPFPWVDAPPSVNRLVGLTWLGRLFYPDVFVEDLRQEVRRFYALFYHRTPDDRPLDELVGPVRPRS